MIGRTISRFSNPINHNQKLLSQSNNARGIIPVGSTERQSVFLGILFLSRSQAISHAIFRRHGQSGHRSFPLSGRRLATLGQSTKTKYIASWCGKKMFMRKSVER